MDKTYLTLPAPTPADVHRLAKQQISAMVRRIASGDMTGVQIPVSTQLLYGHDAVRHYHARPELFLQVSGVSRMRLDNGQLYGRANGLILMPRGVAHQETADSTREPFCNLVFMHDTDCFAYHAGLPNPKNKTPISSITVAGSYKVTHAYGSQLYGHLNEAADFVAAGHPVQHPVVQGLLLAHLGLLLSLVEQSDLLARNTESALVSRCRRMVQEHLADTRLSVQHLAGQLRCTPDYLSNRFRRESGARLTVHINQERCHLAKHLLQTTPWSIKEIAVRCGYAEAGYFSRIFSHLAGANPREFRKAAVCRETGGSRK